MCISNMIRHGDCVQFKVCMVDSSAHDCSGKCELRLRADRQAAGSQHLEKKKVGIFHVEIPICKILNYL